jgi:ribosomal protein L23
VFKQVKGVKSGFKKAVVTLASGQNLEMIQA